MTIAFCIVAFTITIGVIWFIASVMHGWEEILNNKD